MTSPAGRICAGDRKTTGMLEIAHLLDILRVWVSQGRPDVHGASNTLEMPSATA